MPNRNRPSLALMSAMLGLILTGCAAAAGGDGIASVNGEKLSRAEYLSKLESTQQAKSILNQMVQSTLVEQYAKDQNIRIPDSEVQKKEEEIKARYPAGQI